MATFLHRLCLFGLLATTGFALSNCQRQAEEREAMIERSEVLEPAVRSDAPPADSLGTGGAGWEMDAGTRTADGGTPTPVRK